MAWNGGNRQAVNPGIPRFPHDFTILEDLSQSGPENDTKAGSESAREDGRDKV